MRHGRLRLCSYTVLLPSHNCSTASREELGHHPSFGLVLDLSNNSVCSHGTSPLAALPTHLQHNCKACSTHTTEDTSQQRHCPRRCTPLRRLVGTHPLCGDEVQARNKQVGAAGRRSGTTAAPAPGTQVDAAQIRLGLHSTGLHVERCTLAAAHLGESVHSSLVSSAVLTCRTEGRSPAAWWPATQSAAWQNEPVDSSHTASSITA